MTMGEKMERMRRHGVMGAGWCMIVRECRRCRAERVNAAKQRIRLMIAAEYRLVNGERRAEGLPLIDLPESLR